MQCQLFTLPPSWVASRLQLAETGLNFLMKGKGSRCWQTLVLVHAKEPISINTHCLGLHTHCL